MKISAHFLIPLLSLAAACGNSGSTDTSNLTIDVGSLDQSTILLSDDEVSALVYDNFYSVPSDFFVDERASTDRSYTLHHILDESRSYEVCSDDFAVAMAWEEADNASRSVQGYYVESYENARYYEFVRELSYDDDVGNIDDLTSPGFARVFKCSNTNRDGVDRALLSGYAGTLNAHPLGAGAVREFAEYLWQFAFFPNSRKVVLASSGSQTDDELRHTLQLAFSSNQGTGNCDLIEVAEWRFSANRENGQVSKDFEVIRRFEARIEAGTPVPCD
jgi:hypothetical protein